MLFDIQLNVFNIFVLLLKHKINPIKIFLNIKTIIMSRKYTKADLEQIVSVQLENLNAVHDLLSIMKHQNELLNSANKKLKDEISDFKQKIYPAHKRNSNS